MHALLLLASSALAWDHTGILWYEDSMPVHWQMDDATEDSLDYTTDELLDLMSTAHATWYEAECAAISEVIDGIAPSEPDSTDEINGVYWDDPTDEHEAGILGVTIPGVASTRRVSKNGRTYYTYSDQDVVFNDNVAWATPTELTDGTCNNQYDILGVATHEFGHFWGMGHSCEQGDPCTDSLKRDATMFWSVDACDNGQSDGLNQDDIDGLTALYGPFGRMSAVGERFGSTPFTVDFTVESEQTIQSVTWDFGDATDAVTEVSPSHTYEKAGQFSVSATMALEDEVCGTYTYTARELAYVLACSAPEPEEGAAGFFTMSPTTGLTWQIVNNTDVTVYGCIDTIAWQVYTGSGEGAISADNMVDLNGDGDGDTFGAWSPKITFPKAGEYTVVMNVGGPGGLVASYLSVTVEDVPEEGGACSSVSGGSFGVAGLLVAMGAVLRRRRSA